MVGDKINTMKTTLLTSLNFQQAFFLVYKQVNKEKLLNASLSCFHVYVYICCLIACRIQKFNSKVVFIVLIFKILIWETGRYFWNYIYSTWDTCFEPLEYRRLWKSWKSPKKTQIIWSQDCQEPHMKISFLNYKKSTFRPHSDLQDYIWQRKCQARHLVPVGWPNKNHDNQTISILS